MYGAYSTLTYITKWIQPWFETRDGLRVDGLALLPLARPNSSAGRARNSGQLQAAGRSYEFVAQGTSQVIREIHLHPL